MTKLKEMFKKREEIQQTLLDSILKAMPNVLEAAEQFIGEVEGSTGNICWRDVEYTEGDNHVLLLGTMDYEVGSDVELPNGTVVRVTESTQEYFSRILRLGIPYDLAETGSVVDVYTFLSEAAERSEKTYEDQHEELLSLLQGTVTEDDFDLDSLTDEQKQQLQMFMMSAGDKIESDS